MWLGLWPYSDSEEAGNMFIRNTDIHLQCYTASQSQGQNKINHHCETPNLTKRVQIDIRMTSTNSQTSLLLRPLIHTHTIILLKKAHSSIPTTEKLHSEAVSVTHTNNKLGGGSQIAHSVWLLNHTPRSVLSAMQQVTKHFTYHHLRPATCSGLLHYVH